jgi:hypothetical protein
VTLSAKPNRTPVETAWDAPQFTCLQNALLSVCHRRQFKQVLALATVAGKTVRKLRLVSNRT